MSNFKYILAMDTATGPCSVAIWGDGKIIAYLENRQITSQSAQLVPMVEQALGQSNLTYKDLSAVACTVGPGSFTGLRVGLSAARAIGLAAGIPLLGYTTLEVLAYAALESQPDASSILAVLNAGKGEEYYQLFSNAPFAAKHEPIVGLASQATFEKDTVSAGNVALENVKNTGIDFPRADYLAKLAAAALLPPRALTPLYIRPPDAKPMALAGQ